MKKLTPSEFAARIRSKYPGAYDDLSDAELTAKILAKYPAYKDMIAEKQTSQLREFGKAFIQQFNPLPLIEAGWQGMAHPISTAKAVIQDLASRYTAIPSNVARGVSELREGEIQKGTGDILFAHPGAQMILGEAKQELEEGQPGAALGTTAGIAIQSLPPLGIVKGLKAANIPAKLSESAIKRYTQALKPTKLAMKERAEKVIPELLKRRVKAVSLPRLAEEIGRGKEAANEALEDAWMALPADKTASGTEILNSLEKAKGRFMEDGVVMNPAAVNNLEEFQGMLVELMKRQGPDLDVHSLRRVRQIWDRMIAESEGFIIPPAEASKLSAAKQASDAIRKELAKELPDIAKLNKEVSFWADAEDIVSATIRRTRGQEPPIGLTIGGAAAAGGSLAQTGSLLKALGTGILAKKVFGLFKSPGWRMLSATERQRLADALMSGSAEATAFEIGALSMMANLHARRKSPPEKGEIRTRKGIPYQFNGEQWVRVGIPSLSESR